MPITELSKHIMGVNLNGKAYKDLATLSKNDIKSIVKHILDLKNKRRTGKIIEWVNLLLILEPINGFPELKKSGLFRIYNNLDTLNYPNIISEHILKNKNRFEINEESLSFLNSVNTLSQFHSELIRRRAEIVKELKNRKTRVLKTLYSYLDSFFQKNERFISDELSQFPREQIAESVSYIVFLYDELIGVSDEYIMFSDVDYILDGKIERIVLNACYIRLIQETEMEIESLNFKCFTDNKAIKVIPPSPEFAKTYTYGNTLLDMHRLSRDFLDSEISESIVNYARKLNKATNGVMLQLADIGGITRYVMAIPEEILNHLFKPNEGLLHPGFFKEEIRYLHEIENELHINQDDLYKTLITNEFRFYDLLIARRIFLWFTNAYFELLEKQSERDYYSSNVSTLLETTLKALLGRGIGERKTEIFLDLFSYDGGNKLLDIQYTPFLKADNFFLVPFNIIANSNLFRNILYGKKIRIYDNGTVDPLSVKLSNELKDKGFWVKTDFEFKFGKENSDIDVIAIKGNDIFIFECKNNLLPVNAFELRNTFESLEKAANSQLPLSRKACLDKEFIKTYELPIKDKGNPVNIYCCIVTGNKLFSGYSLNGFPIRNVNDLRTFIKKGTVGVIDSITNQPATYLHWDNNTFSTNDLIKYLEINTVFYKYILDSFDEKIKKYEIGTNKLVYTEYEFNYDSFLDNFYALNLRKI